MFLVTNHILRRILFACLVFLVALPSTSQAGGGEQLTGARRIALGNAYTGVSGDFWALFANPAGLVGINQMHAGMHVERRFGLAELNYGSFGFAMPFMDKHYAGIDASGFGTKNYSEARLGLVYATSILNKISIGAKLNMLNVAIPNYGSALAFYVNAGLNVKVTKELGIGFHVYNANAGNFIKSKPNRDIIERIPTILSVGLAYQASDKVMLVADIEKNIQYPLAFHGGVEYRINDFFTARVGVGTQPVILNAGFGINWKELQVDFAGSYHEQLGFTPSLSATYRFGKITESKEDLN